MKLRTTSLAALAAFTLAGPASAATLLNAGFEVDNVTTNTDSIGTPTSWTGYGSATGHGNYVVDGNILPGITGAHSGNQFLLVYSPNDFSQVRQDSDLLWSNVTVGSTLTVSAYTAYRSDLPTGQVKFWLNDSDSSGLNSGAITITDVAAGVWTLRTWNYTVTQATLDTAIAGNWGAVEVGLGNLNAGQTNPQAAFDDVSLVYTIPEPSAALLGGLGMLALLRRRRA